MPFTFRIIFANPINPIPIISNPWGISFNKIIAYIIALAGSIYDIVEAFCVLTLINPSIYRNSASAVCINPNVSNNGKCVYLVGNGMNVQNFFGNCFAYNFRLNNLVQFDLRVGAT